MGAVTDLGYYMENRLIKKMDLIIKRCEQKQPKKDACITMEGQEGEGKTNSSLACAYYIKNKTGRDIHLFFRLKPLIDFAKSTERKIIIWDEPALDSLNAEHFKEINRDLTKLLMTVRKKRHIFFWCFTKFYKFNEYIVVDRSLAMIHIYSKKEIEAGKFMYIRKKNLENLYNGYRFGKKRLYRKYKAFYGSFPEVLERYFDKMGVYINGKVASYNDYESEKDKGILSIGSEVPKLNRNDSRLIEFRQKIANLPMKQLDIVKHFGVSANTLREWRDKIHEKDGLKIQIVEDSPTENSIIQ